MQITEEEKESIDSYRSSSRKYSFLLTEGIDYEEANYKKYAIHFSNINAEAVERSISDIVNVYSAMVKQQLTYKAGDFKVYRGTSVNQIRDMEKTGIVNNFMSASTDEVIARSFAYENDKQAVLLGVYLKEVPYLNVANMLEYEKAGEKEILISPFTKVEFSDITSNWNGIQYRYCDAKKQQLEIPEENERDERINKVFGGCDYAKEKFNEYFSLANKLEDNYARREWLKRLQRGETDTESKKLISKEMSELYEKDDKIYTQRNNLREEYSNWKSEVIKFVKGECALKEKELQLQHNKEVEEAKIRIRNKKIEDFNNEKNAVTEYVKSDVDTYNQMLELKGKYNEVRKEFGLEQDNSFNEVEQIRNMLNQIAEIINNSGMDNIDRKTKILQNLKHNLNLSSQCLQREYEGDDDNLKRDIFDECSKIKVNMESMKIKQKISQIEGSRKGVSGFIDKLMGKDNDKLQQIDDLKNLDIELERTLRQKFGITNKYYSIHQILADNELYVLANNDNVQVKDELNKLSRVDELIIKYFNINREQVNQMKDKMIEEKSLVPIDNKKTNKNKESIIIDQNVVKIVRSEKRFDYKNTIKSEYSMFSMIGKNLEMARREFKDERGQNEKVVQRGSYNASHR